MTLPDPDTGYDHVAGPHEAEDPLPGDRETGAVLDIAGAVQNHQFSDHSRIREVTETAALFQMIGAQPEESAQNDQNAKQGKKIARGQGYDFIQF